MARANLLGGEADVEKYIVSVNSVEILITVCSGGARNCQTVQTLRRTASHSVTLPIQSMSFRQSNSRGTLVTLGSHSSVGAAAYSPYQVSPCGKELSIVTSFNGDLALRAYVPA